MAAPHRRSSCASAARRSTEGPTPTSPRTTDQRGAGFDRVRDAADPDTIATVDIGAYEANVAIAPITAKTMNEDTPLSFSFDIGDDGPFAGPDAAVVVAFTGDVALVPEHGGLSQYHPQRIRAAR